MAIVAAAIHFIAGMFKLQACGRKQFQFRAAALREYGVTGIAIVGLDDTLAVSGLVVAIMASKTAGPILMADVVGISLPTRFHLSKEIICINFLNSVDGRANPWIIAVAIGQDGGDPFESP